MTIFWTGVLIGRVLSNIFAGKIRSGYLMLIFSIISLGSLVFLFNATIPIIIFTSYFIGGLGFSGLFPLLISTGSSIYSKGSGTIMTILYVPSTVGFSVTPFLTRFISQNNLVLLVWLSFIFMSIVLLFLIAYIIFEKAFFRKGI